MPTPVNTSRHLLWLGTGTATMALVVAIMLLLQLTQKQVIAQRSAVGIDSVTAMAYEFDREYLRLSHTLTLFTNGNLSPDSDELSLRYDIFVSRFNLLRANPSIGSLVTVKVYREVMPKLVQLIEKSDADVFKTKAPDRTAVAGMLKVMNDLRPDVQALSMAANQQVANIIEQQGNTLLAQNNRITALTIAQFILLMVASGALFFRHRRQEVEKRALNRLNADLSESRDQLEARVAERTLELRQEVIERKEAQQELARANGQIAATSHRAGMAEVANSVLHDVGNVLNSVNVSVAVLRDQLNQTPLTDLPLVSGLIVAHENELGHFLNEDPQGRQLPQFLSLLSQQWEAEHRLMASEVDRLSSHVEHINAIVSRQQSLSGQSGLMGPVNIREVVGDALAIHGIALERATIQARQTYVGNTDVVGDRNKLTQIVLNLIINAEEAMAASGRPDHLLTVHGTVDAEGALMLSITDNGTGISTEAMRGIFSYGFTTKASGHGFGLHASALAAQEMGGSLTASSDGPGRGATFVLNLPGTLR
jgi:C4-dicarboxylate-specific signal transduction histidine kinase